MSNAAQKIINEGENFTPVPQKPYSWLMTQVSDGAVVLWVYMLSAPPGFNHYPHTLASATGINLRTIQRRLAELLKCGAILKITRNDPGKSAIYYYRPLSIPKLYRTSQNPAPISPDKIEAKTVDNSFTRIDQKTPATTNLSHLTKFKKYPNKSITTPLSSHSIGNVDNSIECDGRKPDLNYYFDMFCRAYPAHKIPYHDKNYMKACFNLFVFALGLKGRSDEYAESATEMCVWDVQERIKHCYHWSDPDSQPSLWSYLKHQRWRLPIVYPVDMHNEFRQHAMDRGRLHAM